MFSVTKPLVELQNDAYNGLRTDLYKFITETSDFPEWKQANFAEKRSDLRIKLLESSLTVEEQTELDYLTSIRLWINTLIVERDRVKTLIYSENATPASIKAAINSFIYFPKP